MEYNIFEIKLNGTYKSSYMVDESQLISNAGSAELYEYNGTTFEIITWNDNAVDHKLGTKTISEIYPSDFVDF